MSKIICDICGTVYPDNAMVCPICGYPRKESEKAAQEAPDAAAGAAAVGASDGAARVRGGRFSNKNVKRRNQTASGRRARRGELPETEPEEREPAGRGLKTAVVVLLVAVIAVGGYIGWRFYNGRDAYDNPNAPVIGTNPSTQDTQPSETTEPTETSLACVDMNVSDEAVEFLGAGRGWKLSITTYPENTEDELVFRSSDENVVTVSADGRLTSVGPGEAVVTITCGQVTKECRVYCNFEAETQPPETTEPVETTEPEETTQPTETTKPDNNDGFKLDRTDVTLFAKGETFNFGTTNNGTYLNPANVEWKSEDPSVATVEGGKVTAVGEGKTTIVATYNGTTQKCIIRCRFDDETPTETTEKTYADSNWKMSDADGDATLIIGESFTLKLTNDAGEIADVTWSSSNAGVVSIDGNVITGKIVGTTQLTATIDGQTFTCIVRVIQNR